MLPDSARILIVDDMIAIRDMVRNHFRSLGYNNIVEAEDGQVALLKLIEAVESGNPFDFVVSDWNMPNMKGIDLLKHVRGHAKIKNTPFVMLTSESEKQHVTDAVLAGVSQYIIKPFSAKMFQDKINSAWQKHKK